MDKTLSLPMRGSKSNGGGLIYKPASKLCDRAMLAFPESAVLSQTATFVAAWPAFLLTAAFGGLGELFAPTGT